MTTQTKIRNTLPIVELLIVDNVAYPSAEPSDNSDPVGRREEDIAIFAPRTFRHINNQHGMDIAMKLLPNILEHHNLEWDDREPVLREVAQFYAAVDWSRTIKL